MGIFDAAKSAYNGNRAYHLHVDANKLAGEGKVAQAKEKFQAALKLYDEAERQGNLAPNILQAYTLLLMREDEFEKARALMEGERRRYMTDFLNIGFTGLRDTTARIGRQRLQITA